MLFIPRSSSCTGALYEQSIINFSERVVNATGEGPFQQPEGPITIELLSSNCNALRFAGSHQIEEDARELQMNATTMERELSNEPSAVSPVALTIE
ncbi:hypothetical protein EAG_08560 [Camponotus floridanus]|uniref:Uncharacterized protein n=1 Tax=Camponotus floridanus TaxID=104421 RepID=E1ZV18_CAMFO|nr:hypothetical protein EAG_08560 [Camponotus floridanus]